MALVDRLRLTRILLQLSHFHWIPPLAPSCLLPTSPVSCRRHAGVAVARLLHCFRVIVEAASSTACSYIHSPTVAPPDPPRSTSGPGPDVLYGEGPVRIRQDSRVARESIAGVLILDIGQHPHDIFSATHWQPGTCATGDSLRRDGLRSWLED